MLVGTGQHPDPKLLPKDLTMPGPKSAPYGGKTARDHKSGKWARRLANRHADPIRERGGKQFGK